MVFGIHVCISFPGVPQAHFLSWSSLCHSVSPKLKQYSLYCHFIAEWSGDNRAKDESCKRSLAATNAGIPPSSTREQEAAYQPESHATSVRSKFRDQDCTQVLPRDCVNALHNCV